MMNLQDLAKAVTEIAKQTQDTDTKQRSAVTYAKNAETLHDAIKNVLGIGIYVEPANSPKVQVMYDREEITISSSMGNCLAITVRYNPTNVRVSDNIVTSTNIRSIKDLVQFIEDTQARYNNFHNRLDHIAGRAMENNTTIAELMKEENGRVWQNFKPNAKE